MQYPEIRPDTRDYDVCSQQWGVRTHVQTRVTPQPHSRATCHTHVSRVPATTTLWTWRSAINWSCRQAQVWIFGVILAASRQPHQAGQYLEIKKWRNVGERCPGVRIWAVFGLLCDVMLITLADRLSRLVCLGNVKKPRLLGCLAVCLAVALLLEIL